MWVKACVFSDVKEGEPKIVSLDGKDLALFKVEGKIYALDNSCPHRGGPLGEGHIENGEVTCPWHAWQFDVRTGECQSAPGITQTTFPVKMEGEEVLIDLPS